MLKFLILSFMIVFLSACGVNTSSSPVEKTSGNDTSGNSNVDNTSATNLDLIDPNPVYSNGGSETNTSSGNGSNNTSTGTNAIVADQNNTIFDVQGAVEDPHACLKSNNAGFTNNAIYDTNLDDRPTDDLEYGVSVNSLLPYNNGGEADSTLVKLFYYNLKPQRTMVWATQIEDEYLIAVDTAWVENDEKVLYVMTPKNSQGYYGCYRYGLKSLLDGTLVRTKVYRYN